MFADTRDAKLALKILPGWMQLERTVLEGYAKSATDHLAAFSGVARNMRMMYAHAYQSYVWNHMVSERLEVTAPYASHAPVRGQG